ncbi:MAG TPA: DUF6580 family putative transport protein [Chthoniobacterales bacterium]|jgi:hypothetical protein|nr:DUF6580 family putative transport protein [Chthoniobacterales bacterium]
MIPALLLVVLAVVYRIASAVIVQSGGSAWLSNFAPLAAIALCSAVYFPRKYKFTVPLAALLVSDIVLDVYYRASLLDPLVLCRYVAFALVGLLGLAISRRPSLKTVLPASLAGSVLFYAITNAFSWLTDSGYVKNFAGLIQALTVGLPQYGATPTWMFFRNSLVSDLLFTLLFVACMSLSRRSSDLPARAAAAAGPLPN